MDREIKRAFNELREKLNVEEKRLLVKDRKLDKERLRLKSKVDKL